MFDLARIRESGLLRQVEFEEEVASTNDWAQELLSLPTFETPALVLAARQTAGRGRGANRWWAADGALTFSLVIAPDAVGLARERWPRVSHCAALAAAEAIEAAAPGASAQLKWPNDVFLQDRKICGVLVEVPARDGAGRTIVGVGVNVNNSLADAPEEIRERATSLVDELGSTFDLTELLLAIVRRFHEALAELVANESALHARWAERCLLTGRAVVVDLGGRIVRGRCCGIDTDGALVVQTADGPVRVLGGIVTEF